MPAIVTDTLNNNLVHSHEYVAADLNSKELIEQKKKLVTSGVKGEMSQWFFDGIRMGHSDLTYSEANAVEWRGAMDVISMGFNLKGNVTIAQKDQGKPVAFSKGHHNIFYVGDEESIMRNEDRRCEMFLVQFNKDAFLRLTENTTDSLMRFRDDILRGKAALLSNNNGLIDFEMQSIITSILNCQYSGGIKKMFFLSKCFEILVLQSQMFDKSASRQYTYCKTAYDKERIVFAKDHIIQNFANPPALPELAKLAGINEFKLKKGFKEVFGLTVFNYLTNYRMEMAKNELLRNSKSISELAYELGYSSPQHFSKAFKKIYAVPPGAVQGKNGI